MFLRFLYSQQLNTERKEWKIHIEVDEIFLRAIYNMIYFHFSICNEILKQIDSN